ncbi:MAG: GNAT family N-acetyltransferase [Bdellovibrionota bacterium]
MVIRVPGVADAQAILDYYERNREHLRAFEPLRSPEYYTVSYWETLIPKFHSAFQEDRALKLFLFSKESPSLVLGAIEYSNFSRGPFQACNLGYSITGDLQGQGFMSEALRATNQFVFEKLGFHRIMANYLPHNIRSGVLLKKLGFAVEGYARDYLKIQGEWQDHILTSLVHP